MTDLIEQYKQLHREEIRYAGDSTKIHKYNIGEFIESLDCKSILDFGCGKGNQYHIEKIHETNFRGVMPSLYDPAVEQYSVLPDGTFDAVMSTDVLEHIEEEDLDDVFKLLYSKANKFVYHGIANFPAVVTLPDGRNAHVIQQPLDWWIEKILPHADKFTVIFVYNKTCKGKAYLQDHKVIHRKIR